MLIDFESVILFAAVWVVPKVCLHVIILHLSPQAILPRAEFLFFFKKVNNQPLQNGNKLSESPGVQSLTYSFGEFSKFSGSTGMRQWGHILTWQISMEF